jgi:two-component system chemotaxis family response regulator WspR
MQDLKNPDVASAPQGDYPAVVLLVDDQPMVGEALRRILSGHPGVTYHYCSDPARAIETAQKVKPTTILQDLVMPGVDGLTLVRQYREEASTKDVPIIVLSTKEEPAIKSASFAAGANDYLVKLPDGIELVARVRHHSKAYLNQLQRDEAYRALRESQQKLVETNAALERLTNVDGLTGLSNRRFVDKYSEMEWKRAIREKTALSVLMIDVDHFKRYNDTYGHLSGDEVLKQVAAAIQKSCQRPADLPARFGGEEFMAILPATPLTGLLVVAENLRRAVEALNIAHSASSVGNFVSVSVGGATTHPEPGDGSFHALIESADKALYEAKQSRNKAVVRAHGAALASQA